MYLNTPLACKECKKTTLKKSRYLAGSRKCQTNKPVSSRFITLQRASVEGPCYEVLRHGARRGLSLEHLLSLLHRADPFVVFPQVRPVIRVKTRRQQVSLIAHTRSKINSPVLKRKRFVEKNHLVDHPPEEHLPDRVSSGREVASVGVAELFKAVEVVRQGNFP